MKIINRVRMKGRDPEAPSPENTIEFIIVQKDSDIAFKQLEVKRSVDMIPEWYKKMDSNVFTENRWDFSIKKCIPFLDAMNTGYYLVTTQDYIFKSDLENKKYTFSANTLINESGVKVVTHHPTEQIDGMPRSEEYINFVFKWANPYQIKTPKGYGTLFIHPMNYTHLPFRTLSGIVDTDYYPLEIHFPFFIKKSFTGVIPKGTPIVQLIPFKKENWKHKVYDEIPEEYYIRSQNLGVDYMEKREPEGKLVGGIYKKLYRNPKKYL